MVLNVRCSFCRCPCFSGVMAHTTTFFLWTSMPAHRSYTMFIGFLPGELKSFTGGARGCQAWVKVSPTCFPCGSDRRWCLHVIQITLVVRLAARISSRSLTLPRLAAILPFFMRGGAPAAHDSLVANSKSGERYHKKSLFSLLGGEYQPPLMLEKNRTSLRKSNSPPISD